jgi:hypothetical protein
MPTDPFARESAIPIRMGSRYHRDQLLPAEAPLLAVRRLYALGEPLVCVCHALLALSIVRIPTSLHIEVEVLAALRLDVAAVVCAGSDCCEAAAKQYEQSRGFHVDSFGACPRLRIRARQRSLSAFRRAPILNSVDVLPAGRWAMPAPRFGRRRRMPRGHRSTGEGAPTDLVGELQRCGAI